MIFIDMIYIKLTNMFRYEATPFAFVTNKFSVRSFSLISFLNNSFL